jgi:hypothetical protein
MRTLPGANLLAMQHNPLAYLIRVLREQGDVAQMRVRMIDLLDSDPRASLGDFSLFLDPLIEWWRPRGVMFCEQSHRRVCRCDPSSVHRPSVHRAQGVVGSAGITA